jgi:predicted NACHT family NTPase
VELAETTYLGPARRFDSGDFAALRSYGDKLLKRYGCIKGPGMSRSWPVAELSIKANLLKGVISCRQWATPEELEDMQEKWDEKHSFGIARSEPVDVIDMLMKESRLMLLGKPGAGKTTLLKFLAIHALQGKLKPLLCFPVLLNLKAWEKGDILDFLAGDLIDSGFSASNAKEFMKHMLKLGNALILLDDLNAIGTSLRFANIQEQICELANRYRKSRFVVTRRIATDSNSEYFHKFANAEVADFDKPQITYFVLYWFRKDKEPAENRLTELKKNIRESATNPLLLTLLCRVLEENTPKLPASRADLFQKGLKVLLKEWDQKLGFGGMEIYRKLSLKGKLRLLSLIAHASFEKDQSFFLQSELEEHIRDFFHGIKKDAIVPKEVLKAMEVQHGLMVEWSQDIYSFSHISFQEYFTAWHIKEKIIEAGSRQSSAKQSASKKALSALSGFLPGHKPGKHDSALYGLVNHLTELRWREVFLLTAELLPQDKANQLLLLMKHHTDAIVAGNGKLQQLLVWAKDKAAAVQTSNRPAAVRGFYLALDRALARAFTRTFVNARALDPASALDPTIKHALDLALGKAAETETDHQALALDLTLDLAFTLEMDENLADNLVLEFPNLGSSLNHAQNLGLSDLAAKLDILKKKHPGPTDSEAAWKTWEKKVRHLMLWYRNLGHNFGLEEKDNQQFKTYLYANKLVASCLHSGARVTQKVRQQILDGLLLPTETK